MHSVAFLVRLGFCINFETNASTLPFNEILANIQFSFGEFPTESRFVFVSILDSI